MYSWKSSLRRREEMVNWIEAQIPLRNFLVRRAGLHRRSVVVDEGTTVSLWLPNPERRKGKKVRPAVVLVHGFAAEGIVTWQFQAGSLSRKYDVYVPDLLFFGGSTSTSADRSPEFQANCLGKTLDAVGVTRCTMVGFSYGGMVAFKLAEMRPNLVEAMVVSGSVRAMTDSISDETMRRLGFSSSMELLLPETVKGLKALLSVAMHKRFWIPNRLYKDYLGVSFTNRKERKELLKGLVASNDHDGATNMPYFPQKVLLLWGDEDQIFNVELAKAMKRQIGENATFQGIKNAGHLVHVERPIVYNKHIKDFLKLVYPDSPKISH